MFGPAIKYINFLIGLLWLFSASVETAAEGKRGIVYAPPRNATEQPKKAEVYSKSYAVVIGIDDYATLPDLGGAVRDARNVAAEMERRGMSVKTLFNQEATKVSITEYLGDVLPNRLKESDRVIIYFAGHGKSQGEGERAMGYLMPVDGHRDRIRSTGISMRELQAWFSDYPALHVLFIADACYSGLAIPTRSIGLSPKTRNYIKQVTSKSVRITLVAGSSDEVAHEFEGQGLFTKYFLEAVGGAADTNDDGLITSDELAVYIKPMVSQTAMAQFRDEQNPQMGRHGEGEFIFFAPNSLAIDEPVAEYNMGMMNKGNNQPEKAVSSGEAQYKKDSGVFLLIGGALNLGFATAVGSFDNDFGGAKPRFSGGGFLLSNIFFNDRFALAAGIGLINAGWKMKINDDSDGNIKETQGVLYLRIPLGLRYKLSGFIIGGGLSLAVALIGNGQVQDESGEEIDDWDFEFGTYRRVNLALDLNLGYRIMLGRVILAPGVDFSFHLLNDNTGDVAEWTQRQLHFFVTLGVLFKAFS